MDRLRAKSASPLSNLRGIAKSANSVLRSPLTATNPNKEPRTNSSTGDIERQIAGQIVNGNQSDEGESQSSSKYSVKSQPLVLSPRDRITSKSADRTDKKVEQSPIPITTQTLPLLSLVVRSKSTYSIHISAFAAVDQRPGLISSTSVELLDDVELSRKPLSDSNVAIDKDATAPIIKARKRSLSVRIVASPSVWSPLKSADEDVSKVVSPPLHSNKSADNLPILEDGFLRDIESKGFSGLWGHSVTRLYILMYLIWRGQENLYIFRLEILDFRNNYGKLNSSARVVSARRIRKLYLLPNSSYPFEWPVDMTDPKISQVLNKITCDLDTAEITIFDDIGFLALQTLEKSYNGTFTPTTAIDHGEGHATTYLNFKSSPFYQAMRNDLRGTTQISAHQYKRVAERVIEMCNAIPMEMSTYENILVLIEELGLGTDLNRYALKKKQDQQLSISKSFTNLAEDPSTPGTMRTNRSIQNPYLPDASANHAFLAVINQSTKAFCEYCFEVGGVEEARPLYTCETCGSQCHKNCRDYLAIFCIKTAVDVDSEALEHSSEKIRLVQEKLIALQREVDIELKIQEGLDRIVKAKAYGIPKRAKKSTLERDILIQLEKNKKRLDVLKHEMQKRTVQLHTIQAIPPLLLGLGKKGVYSSVGTSIGLQTSISTTNISESVVMDTGLLRLLVIDPITKSEFKKAVYITENQSTVEVIVMVLEKSNLLGQPSEFQLSYRLPDEDNGIILKDEDRPTQIEDINYADTLFVLELRSSVKSISKDDPIVLKQQEILTEIIDSESKYLDDLKLIELLFVKPVESSGLLGTEELSSVFCNLEDIIQIHEKISSILNAPSASHRVKLTKMINCFNDAVKDFGCYQKYCGNQYHQRATLKKRQAENAQFNSLLTKCESSPRLHKLSLSDMLMKPMQKITRYPLLLKRLLPNLNIESSDYKALSTLIREVERVIGSVNETVRKMEARFRIHAIDNSLDFGVLAEKFRIATDDRDLVMENTLQYINKAGMPVEVIVLLFNDLILITKRSKKVEGGYILFKTPIPLEAAVFIDQSHLEIKKGFQIAHQKHEIHTFQSYSLFDKTLWLQEAESTRIRYVTLYWNIEMAFLRIQLTRYRSISQQPKLFTEDHPATIGSYFFKSKTSEDDPARKTIKRTPSFAQHNRAPESDIIDISGTVKTTKSYLASSRIMKSSPSSKNLQIAKPVIITEEQPRSASPIPDQDLLHGRTRLSPIKSGGLKSSSSTTSLLDIFKSPFKSRSESK